MFNSQLKNRFIDECANSEGVKELYIHIFSFIEKYEVLFNKDLCEMSPEELSETMKQYSVSNKLSKRTRESQLKRYCRWCLDNYENSNGNILDLDIDINNTLSRKFLASPLQLQRYMNLLFEPEDKRGTDNIYRCYLWLAYAGIPEEDILHITKDNIDLNGMVVKYKGFEFPLYKEGLSSIINCMNLDYFVYLHPQYNKESRFDRVVGNELVRGVKGYPSKLYFRTMISRFSKKALESKLTSVEMSYVRVWTSGLFYKQYVREATCGSYDFEEISSYGKYMKISVDKALEFNKNTIVSDIHKKQAHILKMCYEDDYIKWKEFFKL